MRTATCCAYLMKDSHTITFIELNHVGSNSMNISGNFVTLVDRGALPHGVFQSVALVLEATIRIAACSRRPEATRERLGYSTSCSFHCGGD